MKTLFTIDDQTFPHIRVLNLEQTFEILDGENSGRVLTGRMRRDIIGTYYNYKLTLKPEYSKDGMREYNKLWDMVSAPRESHIITIPYDVGSGVVKTTLTFEAYITSGARSMLKFDQNGVDYWKGGDFQFIAMEPKKKRVG